ncbi:MAG: helix-turn-helix domain-containing protein [Rhodobacteraceae bacterium]|nr:helix-turn-helix domain-containing protein [Paracoccaceae bacterium]
MEKKRTYFPPTTPQHRQLLFKTWEETGNVTEACAKAQVSRQTFYNWKPRFEAGGYEALNACRSHAPHNPHRTAQEVEAQVLEMRRQQPEWGKQRIADELAKRNSWVPVLSANTVKRILLEAGLWRSKDRPEKKRRSPGKDSGRSGANDQY